MSKQIFGYTPSQPAGDAYVKFCAVHENDDGDTVIQVRNERGVINEIILPRKVGAELCYALAAHTKPETTI
jgi:hypothetical protein